MEKERHREAPGPHFQMTATSPMHSQEKGCIDLQPEHTRVEDISALTKVIQKAHTDTWNLPGKMPDSFLKKSEML